MNTQPNVKSIKILNLTRPEALDLENKLKTHDASIIGNKAVGTFHSALDPSYVSLAVSLVALKIIGAWLLKRRSNTIIHQEIEIEHPDGKIERKQFHLEASDEKSEAEVVNALSKLLGNDSTKTLDEQ